MENLRNLTARFGGAAMASFWLPHILGWKIPPLPSLVMSLVGVPASLPQSRAGNLKHPWVTWNFSWVCGTALRSCAIICGVNSMSHLLLVKCLCWSIFGFSWGLKFFHLGWRFVTLNIEPNETKSRNWAKRNEISTFGSISFGSMSYNSDRVPISEPQNRTSVKPGDSSIGWQLQFSIVTC